MNKVLISDKLNELAVEIFKKNGVEVDYKPGLSAEELAKIIDQYHGLAVRSSTKVTPEILDKAKNLKVIGRAGIGVDNIDVKAATAKGVIVMNTPFGNSITTAEHAIAMMFALARNIPQASQSTHEGKWEKSRFMGTELYAKTLGIIGCGNIGQIVAQRAIGLDMKVIAYDPYLSNDKAEEIGISKLDLPELLAQSDFITLHTPLNDKTRNILNEKTLGQTKKGVCIINCARGGLINEKDLKKLLDSGHIAGAALDVYEVEPAKDNILFGHENVICTPHLGASTNEAQINVAIQVAEQMSDYLTKGAIINALNMPSISEEDAPRLAPYMSLCRQLGSFAGQITQNAIESVRIEYRGSVANLDTRPLSSVLIAHFLSPQLDHVNMVNAREIANTRGIEISETKIEEEKDFISSIKLAVTSNQRKRDITGTLFAGREPRIVGVEGVPIEAKLSKNMLFIRNQDKPGVIGRIGTVLGQAKENIADFRLGRKPESNEAVCLVSLDRAPADQTLRTLEEDPDIQLIRSLHFESE